MAPAKFQRLAGKQVLIFGGTSGVGFSVAEGSLAAGAGVTISSSSAAKVKTKLTQLQSDYPLGKAQGFVCDLNTSGIEQNLAVLFEKVGSVDHIVFTACDPLELVPWQELTLEQYQKAGQMRLFAQFLVAKIGSRYMNPGVESSITFTSGTSSEKPSPGWGLVASYAAGLKGLARNLAVDLKPIRVNCVSPGYMDTELWGAMDGATKEGIFDSLRKSLPTGRVGSPEDVAEAYLWLMKDYNVTGSVAESNAGMKL